MSVCYTSESVNTDFQTSAQVNPIFIWMSDLYQQLGRPAEEMEPIFCLQLHMCKARNSL